ncbi:MAG TPA: N-acetylmuramoyl-L-alanine amidase [Desulfonauticus sp.]|nr:MAG: N-acetylmuramoyl-L-alanine amidase [Desulfonauticus sp. 38_4375]HCO11784.1 N-acetylmuramoyl-L-alanine amidase [Desulfonauticus sp.]
MKKLLTFYFFCSFLLLSSPAGGLSLSAQYQKQVNYFHYLLKNPNKAKYRSTWLTLSNNFLKIYKATPTSSLGAKALYYVGRSYEELGKRSRLKKDFMEAIDYFRRVTLHFPHHSWSDDAQLKIAQIYFYNLNEETQAYVELLKVVYSYPQGDKQKEAQAFLEKLDQQKLSQQKKENKTTPNYSLVAKRIQNSNPTPIQLTNIRHWSSDDYTRIVLDLEEETKYFYKLLNPDPKLNTPYRLFIDLENTSIATVIPSEQTIADGILKQIRVAKHSEDKTRVVLDIENIKDYRLFSLNNPYRIVIDVFSEEKKDTSPSQPQINLDPQKRKEIASQNLIEQLGLKVKTIMLDAGHGGKDPGAISHGIKEKDINLRMVKILGKLLKEKGFRVIYTRTTDTFIPLEERTAMANSKKADLFISIHCNAHRSSKVKGLEIYYLNLTKSKDALRVAARENAVSEKSISDLQLILTELMLNSKISESKDLATLVRKECISKAQSVYPSLLDHGVREAPFYVLMGAKMPAILVEIGYLTNPYDRKKMTSYSYLSALAQGLVQGILAYKQEVEKIANLPGSTTGS